MPKSAEFEEKTYEKHFALELAKHAKLIFSPGQVTEADLGFDDSFEVPLCRMCKLFPHLLPGMWLRLPGISLSKLQHLTGRELPQLRSNFIVQYKRPELVIGPRAAEWNSWHCPYYRYQIKAEQQSKLVRVDQISSGRAAVVYASPAFVENDRLYSLVLKCKIIAESNIVPVNQMNGHTRFSYVDPGGFGFAHSEASKVSGPTFEQIMQKALKQEGVQFWEHIIKTAQDIESSLEDDRGKSTFNKVRRAVVFLAGMEDGEDEAGSIAHALVTIAAFSEAFDVSVYAIG